MSAMRQGAGKLADIRRFQVKTPQGIKSFDIYSPEGFSLLARLWTRSGWHHKFSYNITWLGIPVIQLPEDMLILQELIYKIRPDWIIETGTAHGGTAVFYASLLQLLGRGNVISIDVDIRKYNRLAIQSHPMSARITLIEASSVSAGAVRQVKKRVKRGQTVMVMLDSKHTRDHVLKELDIYSKFVSPGSYLIVFDSVMEWVADSSHARPGWKRDNPTAAIKSFLRTHPEFTVDPYYNRLDVTYCHGGFLRKKS